MSSGRSSQPSVESQLMERVQSRLDRYREALSITPVPIEVSFEMGAPIAMGHPWIHFDGLLAHLLFREVLGQDYWLLPGKLPLPITIPLPLSRVGSVWCASVSVFDNDEWTTTTVYKRFTERWAHEIRRRPKSVNIVSGRFRMFMMRLPYLPVRRVVFFAHGDLNRVQDLVRHVRFLGKKAAYGLGRVKTVTIQEIEQDNSILDEHGRAMRPLPVQLLQRYEDAVQLACRPPYWDQNSVEVCAPPGTVVTLRQQYQGGTRNR